MTLRNTALAELVVRHAEAFPDELDMSTWGELREGQGHCGTVACLAGHTLLLSGKWKVDQFGAYRNESGDEVIFSGVAWEAIELLEPESPEEASRLYSLFSYEQSRKRALRRFRALAGLPEPEAGKSCA